MMTSIPSLPFELLLRISEFLLPLDEAFSDPRTAAEDIECALSGIEDFRHLTTTCRGLRTIYSKERRCLRLTGGKCHANFLSRLDEAHAHSTNFLSLERPEICDQCGYHSPLETHEHQQTIRTLFSKLPSVTTLDLANFRVSFEMLHALLPLKLLRTLSIRDPVSGWGGQAGVTIFRKIWPVPQLANLCVVINDFEACDSITTLIMFFEANLMSLSIKGGKQPSFWAEDFLDTGNGIHPGFGPPSEYPKLKHLSFGYLECRLSSLRSFAKKFGSLESLSVDCRGIAGLVPLFYVIDLLREISGDYGGRPELEGYDAHTNNHFDDPENPPPEPYAEDSRVWGRSVACFACSFGTSGATAGEVKRIKSLELEFASIGVASQPLNEDMRVAELTEVFDRRAPTLGQLETLKLSMSTDREFVPAEDNIDQTMMDTIQRDLPSLRHCSMDWGRIAFRFERQV